jgi:hypothetical protein
MPCSPRFFRSMSFPSDPITVKLLRGVRDGIWREAESSAEFRKLLQPFADLRVFGAACGIAQVIRGPGGTSFDALDTSGRQRVLSATQHCAENAPRRLAATARNFYLVKGHGAVQEQLTGVKVNLYAPGEYLKSRMPHLAPTRLTYNREKRRLPRRMGTRSTC